MAKSAVSKRDNAPAPAVQEVTVSKVAAYPVGKMLISSPLEIAGVVRGVRKGKVMTMGELRRALAAKHGADYTCPLTTGIFLRIAAEASEEERALGKGRPLPWWRVVRDNGTLNEKMPGGVAGHARALKAEGVELERAGKANWRVSRS